MEFDLGYMPHIEGEYVSETIYTPMAIVTRAGYTYIAKVEVPANMVPGASLNWSNYWHKIGEPGQQGAQGYTGAQGTQGPAGSGGGGGEGSQGAQGTTGAQGTQGPAGGGSGELAMERKPGLLSVQGNVESAMFSADKSPHAMSVPIWFDRRFKTHVVDVLNMKPVLEAIGFQGSQGAQGSTGSRGAQGYTGAEANVIELTQAEYDALEEKDPNTIYIITDAVGPQGTQGPAGAPGQNGSQGATGSIEAGADVWTFNLVDGTTITRRMYYDEVN